MKKNIEWLKEEMYSMYPSYNEMYVSPDYETVLKVQIIDEVLELIDQLDEPEKVVIPKFVADYIELNKGWNEDRQEYIEDCSSGLWFALNGDNQGMPNSVSDWLFNEEKVETFAKAWLDGFTIANEDKQEVEENFYTFDNVKKWIQDNGEEVQRMIGETYEEPTEIKRGLEAGRVSVEELNRIINAKAHGYDEVPEVEDKNERVHADKDGVEIAVGEITSISFEKAMALVENRMEDIQYDWLAENRMVNKADEIADKRYETPDIINEPIHYKGRHGLEAIEVVRNFGNDDMIAGFYWGNAIKYMTRYRSKNGLEDLKKARKNLDWLIEHTEAIE